MAIMSPVLRLRRAFGSLGEQEASPEETVEEVAEEAADAIAQYSYSRQESNLIFERNQEAMQRLEANVMAALAKNAEQMAEFKTLVTLTILLATGLIIGAFGVAVAILD